MAEHRTQLGLPAREDYIFIAKALSQVKSSHAKRYGRLLKQSCGCGAAQRFCTITERDNAALFIVTNEALSAAGRL